MRTLLYRVALASIAAGIAVTPVLAQQPPGPDRTIDAAERKAVIDGVAERVAANYVFPEVGKKMADDLRTNGGGVPGTVVLMCSYFFDGSTHLNDIYTRSTDSTKQFWSLPVLPGKKLVDKDVYVLTSSRTFSGAEEFAYNLQSQKRA